MRNFSDADQLLKAILSKKLNDTSYDELFKTTQSHREMTKAFRDTIWDVARENTIKARELTATIRGRIEALEKIIAQIGQYQVDAQEQLEQAEKNVEDIRAHVLNIQDDYKVISELPAGHDERTFRTSTNARCRSYVNCVSRLWKTTSTTTGTLCMSITTATSARPSSTPRTWSTLHTG